MNFETILTDIQDSILTITLNRPERLNAWTYLMGDELHKAVKAANEDDDIEALVITGSGRGFCAGADIKEVFKAQSENKSTVKREAEPGDWVKLVRRSKPIVAAVNGVAIGVGLTQILPADVIVASHAARFSARFVKMGLVPELASSYYLVARTGFGQANELILTGKTIDAEEAFNIRLVDKLTSPEDLLDTARATAKAMGENPQTALRMAKELITANMTDDNLDRIQQREMKSLKDCYASAEHKEAINAFLEKREPDFKSARKS